MNKAIFTFGNKEAADNFNCEYCKIIERPGKCELIVEITNLCKFAGIRKFINAYISFI